MKAKTKLEKNKITYSHFMIHSAPYGYNSSANPDKEEIERTLEMIMNSHITVIEELEYHYLSPKEKEAGNHNPETYTGHRKITFHIQQIYRKKGIGGCSKY